jgi:hypothetical protein
VAPVPRTIRTMPNIRWGLSGRQANAHNGGHVAIPAIPHPALAGARPGVSPG